MSQTKVTDALRNVTSVDATKLTGTVDATKLTGTIANARIPASAVTQHVTGYNDVSLRSDILKLAIHSGIDGNRAAFNLDDSFIDTFEDDTGITTKTTVDRDAAGEYVASVTAGSADYTTDSYASGDRTSLITVTRSSSPDMFHSSYLPSSNSTFVDSTTTGNAYINTSQVGAWVKFDFGAGVTKLVTGLQWYLSHAYSHDFRLDASNDDSNWTTIGASIDIGTGAQMPAEKWTGLTHTTKYRYYRLYETAGGTTSGGDLREINFKIVPSIVSATGTLISDPQTASTSRTSASGIIIYEDANGTNVLGTDLKVYFSCNNSAWTEASSYGTATTYSGTKKLVKLGATTCTAGTAIAMKAVWANQVATVAASQVLIAQNVGTAIGNMTSNGGLAAAFNGNNNQAYAQNSVVLTGSAPAFIGKDWGSGNTKTITGVKTWGSNETGYSGVGAATSHFLYGSNSAPTGTSDGTLITTLVTNTADVNGTNPFVYLTGIDATTAYRYHWLTITTPSNSTGQTIVCELEFYGEDTDGVVGKEARLHGWAINY